MPVHRTSRLTIALAVGLTLLIGLAVTTTASHREAATERAARAGVLKSVTDDTVARVTSSLTRYQDLIESLAAFQAQSNRSMGAYQAYVAALDVGAYPGVLNTEYIQAVTTDDLARLVAELRSDGQPDFGIESPSGEPEHAIIAYAAPGLSAVPGYDLTSDVVRDQALLFARDSGLPGIAGAVVPLAQGNLPTAAQSPGLVVFDAVYAAGAPTTKVDERRAALLGWTSISVDLQAVVTALALDDDLLNVVVRVQATDGSYVEAGESHAGAAHEMLGDAEKIATIIETGSRNIEIDTAFVPGGGPDVDARLVTIGGSLVSLFAAYGVYATLRFRRGILTRADAERRRAELLSSRFHAAVDKAPVGVTVVGLDGTVELVNDRLAELLQVSASDNVSISAYYLEEELPEVFENFGRLARGEVDHFVKDRRLRRSDGSLVWCRVSSSTLRGPDGRPTAIVAHVEDIEAERRAIEELRSRSRWFSSIVERSSDLIGLLDRDGVVTWASPSAMEILGNAPELLIGLNILPLVLPEDRERLAEAILLVQTGVQVRIEYRVRTLAGQVIWLETTANDLLDDPDVASIITFSRDVTERHRTDEILAHKAAHDMLTGLLNRAELVLSLEAALSEMRSSGQQLTVAYLDLDGFKGVNDQHGHAAGDDVLRIVAGVLQDEVRAHDAVARLGGDEFVVVLRGAGLPAAMQIAERMRRRMHESFDLESASEPVRLSLSIGLAAGTAGDTVDSLLHEADLALYEAKRRGRDRVEISSHGLTELGLEVDELLQSVISNLD